MSCPLSVSVSISVFVSVSLPRLSLCLNLSRLSFCLSLRPRLNLCLSISPEALSQCQSPEAQSQCQSLEAQSQCQSPEVQFLSQSPEAQSVSVSVSQSPEAQCRHGPPGFRSLSVVSFSRSLPLATVSSVPSLRLGLGLCLSVCLSHASVSPDYPHSRPPAAVFPCLIVSRS